MFEIEGFGSARFDPSGRSVIFERLRPYGEFEDYSFGAYAQAKSGHQLWRADVSGVNSPALLDGLDPAPSSYIEGFSPSGRFATVLQYQMGRLAIGAYDLRRRRVVLFGGAPVFKEAEGFRPVWVSNDQFIYSALPDGEQPGSVSVRAYTGLELSKAWEKTWRGTGVTANEIVSIQSDKSKTPAPGRLIKANARTGDERLLAEGRFADLRLAPDGRRLAALQQSLPQQPDPDGLNDDWINRQHDLVLIDLASNALKRFDLPYNIFNNTLVWSADAKRLAFFAWDKNKGPRQGRFRVLDLASGDVSTFPHDGLDLASERERGFYQRPERAVFLGDRLAVFARDIPKGEDQSPRFTYRDYRPVGLDTPGWYLLAEEGAVLLSDKLPDVSALPLHAGRDHITVTAKNGVWSLYGDGRRVRLTPKIDGVFKYLPDGSFMARAGVARPEFGEGGAVSVKGEGGTKIVLVDFREGREAETVVVDAPSSEAAPLAGSIAAGAVLFRLEDGDASKLLLARKGAPHREIARINDHLNQVDFGAWKTVTYNVKDPEDVEGTRVIESCVLLPPGYVEGKRYPLIVEAYPNVGPSCRGEGPKLAYSDPTSPYLWAARGYIYSRLSTPRDLIRAGTGPIAGMDEVLTQGVEALVGQGFVDGERTALFGFSQGGISSLYVASQTDRFRAVVSMNGWADLFSHYFAGHGVFSYLYSEENPFGSSSRYDSAAGTDFGIGATPFESPDIYIRNSPVFLAPKIETPILMIHSDMDSFGLSQYDEMFGALYRLGKEARYVRYWGEGHGPSSPANIRDMWRRIDAFLAEQDVEPHAKN